LVAVQDPRDGTTRFDPVISSGECPDPGLLTDQLRSLVDDGGRPRFEKTAAGLALLAPSFYAGSLIGAVILWRNPAGAAWNDVDLRLAATLAEHIAPVIEQRNDYNRLLDASRTDALTGLLNRRAFDEELLRRVQRLNRDRRRGALLYLDLDNFKAVNDRRGHAVGDEALRHVADILRGNTRGIDLVARLGGDEFAVWLENLSEVDAAKRAKVFLAAGASLVGYSGSPDQPLQVSIGVAPFDPERAETVAALMKRADAAMYQVKHAGKGNYFVALLPEKE
jgi:diguanylate cyclase (GGDEF)-like protein